PPARVSPFTALRFLRIARSCGVLCPVVDLRPPKKSATAGSSQRDAGGMNLIAMTRACPFGQRHSAARLSSALRPSFQLGNAALLCYYYTLAHQGVFLQIAGIHFRARFFGGRG